MTEDSIIKRIEALLAKAERTDNEHERVAFMEKAEELLLKYEIDRAMLFHNTGKREPAIAAWFDGVTAPYKIAKWMLLVGIANVHNCKTLRYGKGTKASIRIFGFESDIEIVKMLYASLLVQCANSMARDVKTMPSYEHGKSWKNTYIHTFAAVASNRMAQERRRGLESVDREILPVLYNRKQEVENLMESQEPGVTKRKGQKIAVGRSGHAMAAGREAANRADIGHTRIGQRKQLSQ